MANSGVMKFLIFIGIFTLLSGIYFVVKGEYIEGGLGIVIGAFIIFMNKLKSN